MVANAVILPDPGPAPNRIDVPISGTSVAERPELAGTILEDINIRYDFDDNGSAAFHGTVQHRVTRSSTDNTLIFSWRIMPEVNTLGANVPDGWIMALRMFELGDILKDADYRTDSLGNVAPTHARHFYNGTVTFLFDDSELMPSGNSSHFMFIKTEATQYARTGLFDIIGQGGSDPTGDTSQIFDAFVPVIPEPVSLALLGVGNLALLRRGSRVGCRTPAEPSG
jgi:hypothetical protein